jgi:Protein of unknown function (DUF2656)
MNDPQSLRMLLSHNFDLTTEQAQLLSRTAFAQVFIDGFAAHPEIQCRQVDNPHWIVEIISVANGLTPQQIGEKCAQILFTSRQQSRGTINFDILILAGIKTTPATSSSPVALQANQWGVDVVETRSGEDFLRLIGWENTTDGKSVDDIFKVEIISTT